MSSKLCQMYKYTRNTVASHRRRPGSSTSTTGSHTHTPFPHRAFQRPASRFQERVRLLPITLFSAKMSDSKTCTIRTRKFLTNQLLQRKQFVSYGAFLSISHHLVRQNALDREARFARRRARTLPKAISSCCVL